LTGVFPVFSIIFGLALVCFVGPLAYFPFVLRIYRLKLVFQAQERYFNEKKKPIELI